MKACRGRQREIETLQSYHDDILIDLGHRLQFPSDQGKKLIPKYIEQLQRLRKEIRRLKMQG